MRIFFIFVLLINVAHAKENFTETKLSLHCNLPHGYVDKSLGRDFNFMKLIELSKNGRKHKGKYSAMVDDEDYDFLMQWCWCVDGCGYVSRGINIGNGKTKNVKMHRLIMGVTNPKVKVDHKFGNKFDNMKCNLRVSTNQQNCFNQCKPIGQYTSIYKGVSIFSRLIKKESSNGVKFHEYKRLRVAITINGKTKHIATFKIGEDILAAKAYDEAAKKYFGEFAKLNFPNEQPKTTI